MTQRIAEFADLDDAQAFLNMKGKDNYSICAGIRFMWAVMPKPTYAENFGPFEPPDIRAYSDDDDDAYERFEALQK